jgi:hypothetical protein
MDYNILLDANLNSTTSGISGYTNSLLASSQIYGVTEGINSLTVTSGYYIGISADFGMDIVCKEARVYASQVSSGVALFHYKEFLMNQWVSHGDYNYNTGYSTPIMYTDDYPEPYVCSGTTSWDASHSAYKAFTQTNTNSSDCWLSGQGAGGLVPQSLMFYFPYPKVINKYMIQSRNISTAVDRHFPKDFILQGNTVESPSISIDSHWEALDTRTGISDPGQALWSSYFKFSNAKAYHYYRLKITASSSTRASIAELKLVEANRAESVPLSVWYQRTMTYSGGIYTYTFDPPQGVEQVKFFLGTKSSILTVSGIELICDAGPVSVSGNLSTTYFDSYTFTPTTLDPITLTIKNLMGSLAQPNVLVRYTGNYEVDRNILVSPDYTYSYSKSSATWYNLDYGWSVPENDSFERGVFINTRMDQRAVILEDGTVSGSWKSPVVDTANKMSAIYVYTQGNAGVSVRASDTPPPEANFLVVTTDNSAEELMYNHKRIYLDSAGDTIGSGECNPPLVGNKIWRVAPESWADSYLQYYGAINELGTVAVVFPGYTNCGDTSPEQEWTNPNYWYPYNICKVNDSTKWNEGITVSGLSYGPTILVSFTKTFSVPISDSFFCFIVVSDTVKEVTTINLSFLDHEYKTRGTFPIISFTGVIAPEDKIDVAFDASNNNWWVYVYPTLYKVDVGSINNTRTFGEWNPQTQEMLPDSLEGYIWSLPVSEVWKKIISIPSPDFSYFWAFTDTYIYLYEERYSEGAPELVLHHTINAGVQVETEFSELHCGSCDEDGNLWVLDLDQERVMRINFKKALNQDARAVEYENQVAGVLSLWAHPTNGTCYLFISDEPEHSHEDIIRMVHVSQRWGSQGKYVCSVPGFYSQPYPYGVQFTGKVFNNGIKVQDSNSVWGTSSDSIAWQEYGGRGRLLPRGRYKQIKIELVRDDIFQSSPRLQKIRMPKPLVLNYLGKNEEAKVAIKTTFNNASVYGDWDAKLNIWWIDEDI